jgi:shikimate kinase
MVQIFAEEGVAPFREAETEIIRNLAGVRNHVLSVGGGALEKDENFHILKSLGILVWVDVAPMIIARRFAFNPSELKKRMFLTDLIQEGDRMETWERLRKRLEILYNERVTRYAEAAVVLRDNASTPEVCARRLIDLVNNFLDPKRVSPSGSFEE